MKRLMISILAAVLLLAVPLGPAASAGKTVDKIQHCALQTNYAETGGKMWVTDDGTVLHGRGITQYAHVTPLPGFPECETPYSTGEVVLVVNFDLNLVTGEGESWGKHTLQPAGLDGTITGRFAGVITNTGYRGKGTGHGTGALKGLVEKFNILQVGEVNYEIRGVILEKTAKP